MNKRKIFNWVCLAIGAVIIVTNLMTEPNFVVIFIGSAFIYPTMQYYNR